MHRVRRPRGTEPARRGSGLRDGQRGGRPRSKSMLAARRDGPGEAAQTEIGITGGGNDSNLLYLSGIPHKKVLNNEIISQVVKLVEEKVKEKNN